MSNLDIITAEVIRNGVVAAAREMGTTLVRTAYNPLLYEVQDFGLAHSLASLRNLGRSAWHDRVCRGIASHSQFGH